jgi:23S rRNA-/tRNA-specific pseudouridylate synthase
VPKPDHIELPTGEKISILYEDRSVLAIDKPRGTMLAPVPWQRAGRNRKLDPFVRRRVEIRAPLEEFVREYGFDIPKL